MNNCYCLLFMHGTTWHYEKIGLLLARNDRIYIRLCSLLSLVDAINSKWLMWATKNNLNNRKIIRAINQQIIKNMGCIPRDAVYVSEYWKVYVWLKFNLHTCMLF